MNPETLNFRAATNPQQSCGSCANFQQGACALLQIPVTPEMVCDAWSGQGAQAQASAPAPDIMSQLFGPSTNG